MEKEVFREHLVKDLIPFWNRLKDEKYGGFYGYADGNGKADPAREKGVILTSRILWFYSASYRLLEEESLLEMARHAYRFLAEHCVDKEYGGVYWSVTHDGRPLDTTKHSYNQAFAIYALSAFYEASGDKEALELAYDIYRVIEEKCVDEGGYLEAFERDFAPADNDKLSENGVMAQRTMNTLLHVMEAYTQLYKTDASPQVRDRLEKILGLFKEKIYDPEKKQCRVFFDADYRSLIDLDSYGHDIEASWLIWRACEVLGSESDKQAMRPVIDGLAEGVYRHGIDRELFALNNECERGVMNRTKIWWVQAEAVIGFYNAFALQPQREEYRECSKRIWEFIRKYVIDPETGEWVENIERVDRIDTSQALVHPWKCPYHNGRMCIEMTMRLSKEP